MSNDNPWIEDDLDADDDPRAGAETERGTAASAEDLERDLRKLQEDRDSLFTQLARTTADFRNAQKRLEADKLQAIQYANTSLVKSLLPILDNFHRALEVDPATVDAPNLLKGMQIVHDQFLKALDGQAVQEIAPEPGTPFDPNQHEALMQQPSDKYADPTVLQLLQKGYAMHDRVLRPAQVIVSKQA